MERYARHVVYRRCLGEQPRPHRSFDTLREAIDYVDGFGRDGDVDDSYQVIDLEHLHLGDMRTSHEAARTVALIRASLGRAA